MVSRASTRARALHFVATLIWLAYFLVPTSGGWVDGVPAGPVDTVGLLLVLWIAGHSVRPGGERLVLAALIVGVAGTAALPGAGGFQARYFPNASATGAHERGTEYPDAAFTRIDERLEFGANSREFPLAFFNDNSRFNFYRPGEPHRRRLEFSVAWTGWWWTGGGSQTLYLDAPSSSARLYVDGVLALDVSPQSGEATQSMALSSGWHRLHVTFLSPYAAPRQLSAGIARDGQRLPFDAASVRTERLSGQQRAAGRALSAIKSFADAAALLWLSAIGCLLLIRRAGEAWQRPWQSDRAVMAIVIALGAVEAMRFAWPWTRQALLLAGGDDPMTYEGYARDIQFNGILMNRGLPPGEGEPFYYQAFYPYFLAAAHAVFGEGMFGVMLMQRLFVVLVAVAVIRIAVELAGPKVWPAALVIGGLFSWWKFAPIAADLLNESLYLPLMMAWTATLIRTCREPSTGRAATTGLFGGLAAITRSTAILSWPIIWLACGWPWRRSRRGTVVLGTMVVCSLAVFSLIGIRNWIVAHRFVPASTELGITLLGGNEPPPELEIDLSRHAALYQRLGVSANTAKVVEYAMIAPGAFALGIGRKALFALGFYEPYAPDWGYSPVYILVWSSAIFGLVVAIRAGHAPPTAVLLPLVIALTQYVAVVIVYPKGERLILPVHTALVPYAAIAAHAAFRRLADRISGAQDRHRPSSSPVR